MMNLSIACMAASGIPCGVKAKLQAIQCAHCHILIRTVDTDVVVISVMVLQTHPDDVQIWLAFGKGQSLRYIAAHKISAALGSEKCCALPMFHAITGCDPVSAFVGYGKITAWNT